MSQIGRLITHKRYGKAKVTHIDRMIINPVTRVTKLRGLTFELLTDKGKALFNKDRRLFYINDPLPRCYERNLNLISLVDETSEAN
jgi:hypothetical protein